MGCNYLSLPEIPVSDSKVLICGSLGWKVSNISCSWFTWLIYPRALGVFLSHDGSQKSQNQLIKPICSITHLPLVPHTCGGELGRHWFRYWLGACSAPSHYLNQCWPIVNWNWTFRNKLQWNSNRNTKFFIDVNALENVVCQIGGHFVQGEMS